MKTGHKLRRGQGGSLLIEVLVAVLLCAFSLLGFASLQARAAGIEFEAQQRSQALTLVEDMLARIDVNRSRAGEYVSTSLIGAGAVADCSGLNGSALDLCEWGNLLRGTSETRGGARVGSMQAARGCITRAAGTTHRFVVAVVWQGLVPSGAAASPCGDADTSTYPDASLRRVSAAALCVALLRDGATPPAVNRC